MAKCRHHGVFMLLEDEDGECLEELLPEDVFGEGVLDELKMCLRCEILDSLRKFLSEEMVSPEYCPNCGGMLPELAFKYNGKVFRFTCYMIEENGKAIAKTNYAQFAKYCKLITDRKGKVVTSRCRASPP